MLPYVYMLSCSHHVVPFHNSAVLRCELFSEKNIEKKRLYLHDKNFYYFWKSDIPVANLIVDSRNMNKGSKKMRL